MADLEGNSTENGVEVKITWLCENNHSNWCQITVDDFEDNNEFNNTIEAFVADPTIQRANPCHECGKIGFCDTDWNTLANKD